jgi:O-antigen/teichoic acid export membrane protein
MAANLTENQLKRDGTILFLSNLLVNAGNYGINLLLGRWLGPSEFSEVSLLVTLLLMLSFWALAFQLTATKYIAEFTTDNKQAEMSMFLKWFQKLAVLVGIVLAILLISLSIFWKEFFQMSSPTIFIIFGIGMPFYLLMSVNRGILQGKTNYRRLAITYQAEMWTRLILSIVLIKMGYGVSGVAWGLTLSIVATWLVSNSAIIKGQKMIFDNKKIIQFFLVVLTYECSQILINNSDTVLVKHFFTPTDAGLYAALALIGRIVYFGTWTVVTMLFPIVIKLEKEGKDHTKYFWGGLGFVGGIAGIIIIACYIMPELMVNILFGEKYLSIAPLLWLYALATALFALVNVFVYYNMSLDRRLPVWLTIIGGILQILLIYAFHNTFEQVIQIQVYLMSGLLMTMILYQFLVKKEKISLHKSEDNFSKVI